MIYLIIALVILGILCMLIELLDKHNNGTDEDIARAVPSCATCTGADERCEQVCMMKASLKDIEYYDDEELDVFKGRQSDNYTNKEIEQFAEVLHTIRQDEVKGWNRSLILRSINLPDSLKDEVIMLIENN